MNYSCRWLFGAVFLSSTLFSCHGNGQNPDVKQRDQPAISSEKNSFYVDTVYNGLENPWGITWLPDGRMLVGERKGEILIFDGDIFAGKKVKGFPEIYLKGQSGLLDIQLHPNYATNGWIYATYAKPGTGGGSTTLVRFKLEGDQVSQLEELLQTQPITNSSVHFGSRIIFDNEGYVYFSTGDRGVKENAQDLSNDMGKVHRLHDDGRIPEDNPFVQTPGARPSIWSYGHRNVQGMVYNAEKNIIYTTEHGPRGGDELNVVEKGKNYGWPIITYGIDYSGAIISDISEKEGMEQPIHYWNPSIATCGLLFYTGDKFPEWKGNVFSGALALTHVARVEVDGKNYQHQEKLLDGYGRVRQVAQSPDGYIYVLIEGPGMVLKLVPAAK
jgi:glucose/arabinose dehydrogenase